VRYVLDSNVALKCFLPEESSDLARGLLSRARAGSVFLIAPEIFLAEVAHSLRREVVRKRLPIEDARSIWQDICTIQIDLRPIAPLADDAFSLALEHMGAVYDALYVALAIREDLKVVTADDRMASAFARVNRTVTLASFE
jgi:predicted nucleic acid-binding protein